MLACSFTLRGAKQAFSNVLSHEELHYRKSLPNVCVAPFINRLRSVRCKLYRVNDPNEEMPTQISCITSPGARSLAYMVTFVRKCLAFSNASPQGYISTSFIIINQSKSFYRTATTVMRRRHATLRAKGHHMRIPVYRYIRFHSIVKCTMLLLYIEISKEISEETGCSNVRRLKRHNGLLGYKTSQFLTINTSLSFSKKVPKNETCYSTG